jgi:hypothetical protein
MQNTAALVVLLSPAGVTAEVLNVLDVEGRHLCDAVSEPSLYGGKW